MAAALPAPEAASPLQRLDPRTRLLSVLLFILGLNLVAEGAWFYLAVFAAVLGLLIVISGIGFAAVFRRSLAAAPFLFATLAIPFVTPGKGLWTLPLVGWEVTDAGLTRFATLLVRFILAVHAAVLLVSVTPPPALFNAMHRLGAPAFLIAVVNLMYRYLAVIPQEGLSMLRARAARSPSVARRPPLRWQARVTGAMVGSLFLRTVDRSERIFSAMMSRGFDGTIRSLESSRLAALDWMVLATWGGVILLLGWGRFW